MPRDTKPQSLDQVIGANVRRIREERGVTQDELAFYARGWGLSWVQPTIAALEQGRKTLDVIELGLLNVALATSSAELLAGDDDQRVRVGEGTGRLGTLRQAILGPEPVTSPQHLKDEISKKRARGEASSEQANVRAAAQLGVDPADVSRAAFRLWKRSLTEERDARVAENAQSEATPRTIQALRGRVTRVLLEELRLKMKGKK